MIPEAPSESELRAKLDAAVARRRALVARTDAMRLVHGAADGLEGLVIERFASHLLVRYSPAPWAGHLDRLCRSMQGIFPEVRGILAQEERRDGRERRAPRLIRGEALPEDLRVTEDGLQYFALIGRGASSGLFLDMREHRRDFARLCTGRRVLNLFCYTGSFGVAALDAGAEELVSVDVSRPYLDTARQNLALNGLADRRARWIREDAMVYLARLQRRGERFGAVICDPPSFGKGGKGRSRSFSVERAYPSLASLVWSIMETRAAALFACNCVRMDERRFTGLILEAAREHGIRAALDPRSSACALDFPPIPDAPEALKVVFATHRGPERSRQRGDPHRG